MREVEVSFDLFFDSMPDMIAILDVDFKIIRANKAMADKLGVVPGDCVNLTCFSAVHDTKEPPDYCPYRKLLSDGKRHVMDIWEERIGGSLEISVIPLKDDDGVVTGCIHIAKDINERKRHEESIERNSRKLQEAIDIIDRSPAVAYRRRNAPDRPIEYTSNNVEKITGYTREEFINGTVEYKDVIHGDDEDRVNEEVVRNSVDKGTDEFKHEPYRIIAKDGRIKWVDDNTYIVRDDGGEITHYEGLIVDVTDRVTAAKELERKNKILEAVNEVMRSFAEVESEEELAKKCLDAAEKLTGSEFSLISVVTNEGLYDVLAVGESLRKYFGGSTGVDESDLRGLAPRGIRERIIKSGKSEIISVPATDPDVVSLPQGHPRLKELLCVPMNFGGEAIGVIVLANKEGGYNGADVDIIEILARAIVETLGLKKAEVENRYLKEKLFQSQKMESIGRLAGGVAHEFNNMLSVIMGNSHLALMDLKKGDAFHDEFDAVMKAAERSKEITMKLLSFARTDKMSIVKIKADSLIEDVVLMLKRGVSKRINVTCAVEDAYVEVDVNQIQQVLLNVCNNAVDAMPRGGNLVIECGEISFDADARVYGETIEKGSYCRVRISDDGKGIPQNVIPKVFDPFFTTKKASDGTGLGLSLAHGIIENHNGFIFINGSLEGGGTAVEIFLPAATPFSETEKQLHEKRQLVRHGLETILVVDDETYVLEMTGKILHRLGFTVKLAASGREAIEKFRESPDEIDIVILDVMMLDVEGPDVFTALKEIDPAVNVILASGYSAGERIEGLLSDGAKAFIQKPFQIRELTKTIREALA